MLSAVVVQTSCRTSDKESAMSLLIENLSKKYKNGTTALDGINLSIQPGLFGLLGPNGAGKSTLMRTLATLQSPDTGTITMGDIDVLTQAMAVRRKLGYLPQDFGVYPGVSAEELLNYFALLKGLTDPKQRRKCVHHLLNLVNLYEERKKAVSQFSGGMRQRFGVAQALISDPYLLIVDEPTAGLDPMERSRLNALLNEISQDRLVILSTHIVSDVWDLCPDMAILNKGKVAFKGAPSAAVTALKNKVWESEVKSGSSPIEYQGLLLSNRLRQGRTVMRVYNEQCPGDSFLGVEPDLQDAYFKALKEA